MAIKVRKDVWTLAPSDTTLSWYRKAVAELIKRPLTDPSSWRYLAAIHGTPRNMPTPAGVGDFWDQCQHQSWFFLPWHRGYLASFEAIVAKTVQALGGPSDWSLPFWDYSATDPSHPNARLMPAAFRDRLLSDGTPNALWSRRAQALNGDFGLDESVTGLGALRLQTFANARPGAPSGFGGPVTGFNPGGGDNGALENVPHNRIHVKIGGDTGFMSDPSTAALDPIFWLHHANIDRLWEVWRNQGPQFANPDVPQWLTAVTFQMHDADGKPFTFQCADMLDTTGVLHGYRYDNVPVAHEPQRREILEAIMTEGADDPELAGATEGPVALTGAVTKVDVVMAPAQTTKSFSESVKPTPQHAYLSLENITGVGIPGDYKVYVDLPQVGQDPALAGVMTTFGLERASDPARSHGGSGLNQVFEITELAERIGLTSTNVSRLKVTFVREGVASSDLETPEGLSEYGVPSRPNPAVSVGRISLYYD